ncbi:hypothetical protein ACQKP0_15380 [Heyndrickxia sp. NPDC080065]|uniref:hypothetical protein n=1 Tax=Heyndrickxia sp. NPDC080065 TaxID=3390568 RepID=UPI003D0118D8
MNRLHYYIKLLIFNVQNKFSSSFTHFILIFSLFIADILFILSDFTAFLVMQPEALPTILLLVFILYIWRKYSLSQRFPALTRIQLYFYSIMWWNWTLEWIAPSLRNRKSIL